MAEIIKYVALYGILVPLLLTAYIFITIPGRRRWELVAILIVGGVVSLFLAKLGGHFINDPRPFVVGRFTPLIPHAPDNGFPSDHTLLASFLGYVLWRYSKWAGIVTLAAAICIGFARMYVGVHHLEDIVGSFVIAAVSTLVAIGLLQLYHRHNPTKQNS